MLQIVNFENDDDFWIFGNGQVLSSDLNTVAASHKNILVKW